MSVKSDQTPELQHDTLGRNNIALEIVNGLLAYSKKNKDALTISITGEWGSGKTTLMEYIKLQLKNSIDDNFKLISFNPWMFFKDESIKEAFLMHLALSLKGSEARITKAAEKLTELLKAFRWVKYVHPIAGKIQEGIESVTTPLGEKLDVHEIKEEINTILRKGNKKILVFIDDIDRLMPSQISELFQTISLITNFSNIIYIVAFDREIVIDAIGKDFNNKGQEYLEKIIQVDYEIPTIQDDKLEYIFYRQVQEIAKVVKVQFDMRALKSLWSYHGLKDYFQNLRDYKRFFNSLSFRMPIIADEINPVDFLIIEAVRIFDYSSYNKFYKGYRVNARKRELPAAGLSEDQFKSIGSPAAEIIKSLSIKSTLHQYRREANSKRLLDPAYFDRYFSLAKNDSDIGENELRELITRASVRKAILEKAVQYDRIDNLIKRLSDKSLHKFYDDFDYSLIKSLIEFFNDHHYLLHDHSDRVSDMVINLICGSKNKKVFLEKFIESFGKRASPPSLLHLYFFYFMRKFIKSGDRFRSDHTAFDDYYKEHYLYIEKIYLPIFKSAASNILEFRLTDSWPGIKFLYQRDYAELFPEEYQTFIDATYHDKPYLLYLANQFVRLDPDDNSFRNYEWLNDNSLFPGNNLIKFYAAIKEMAPQSLDEKEKAIQHHFLAIDISDFPTIKYPVEPRMKM